MPLRRPKKPPHEPPRADGKATRRATRHAARLSDPSSEYVEIWAVYQQSARTYRLFAFLFALGMLGFAWGWHGAATTYPPPMVVRVDAVGKAVPVQMGQMGFSYSAVDPITRYFLTQYLEDSLTRERSTVVQRWRRSLSFLAPALLDRESAGRVEEISRWASGQEAGEVTIEALDLLVQDSPEMPYQARASCQRVRRLEGGETTREPLVIEIEFVFLHPSDVPAESVLVNPLGLVLTHLEIQLDLGF